MKKITLLSGLMLAFALSASAGGYLTNTNQHVSFLRMVARGASTDIDAIYTNPAGLGWLNHEGWTLSMNIQNAAQHRDIQSSFRLWDYSAVGQGGVTTPVGEDYQKFYSGRASAPIIPSAYLAYKKDRFVLSGSLSVVGGGGKASYDDGLPMFDSALRFGLANNPALAQLKNAVGASRVSDLYDLNTAMNGAQYIYGAQLGLTYKFTSWLSGYAGGRMNYFDGGYDGFVHAVVKEPYAAYYQQAAGTSDRTLYSLELDCDQTGWGLTPILGVGAQYGRFTFGGKYEFKTNLNLQNRTHRNTDPNGALADFAHGVNTPSDIPAILSLAVGYEILPQTLRATAEYHHYYDKQAEMANQKQKYLKGGTSEWAFGVEWDAHRYVTLSAGGQITNYGLADGFQTDTSFSCDSYSVGFGAGINLSPKARLNVAYFWTTYDDYTKHYTNTVSTARGDLPSVTGINVYQRTNKVFGVGLDYRF